MSGDCPQGVLLVEDTLSGSKPPFGINTSEHERNIDDRQSPQKLTLVGSSFPSPEQNPHTSERQNDTLLHEKCVICVSDLPIDIREVIDAWDSLPEAVKAGVVAMVKAALQA